MVLIHFLKSSLDESRTHSVQLRILPNPITIIIKKKKMHQIQGYFKKKTYRNKTKLLLNDKKCIITNGIRESASG